MTRLAQLSVHAELLYLHCVGLRAYRCSHCGGWHVGRKPGTKRAAA